MVVMEVDNNSNRSELWYKIYSIVKELPRKECLCDAPDACSISAELEILFIEEYAKI